MLSLSQINEITNSKDGDIYSDLYKDVYGSRPRYAQFASIEEFDKDFEYLAAKLSEQLDEEKIQQDVNLGQFKGRVQDIMILCDCDRERAIEIIADAEDELDGFQCYGYERLEWYFNLKFGAIKEWLAE